MWHLFDIMNIFKNKDVPPILRGTKVMIKQLAREERKIATLNKASPQKGNYMTKPKEDMSEIFVKYVNKDFNKDAYLFVK